MQTRILLFIFFGSVFLISCNAKKSTVTEQPKDSLVNKTFFPVTEFILGELNQIDSLPVTPLKIITLNGKEDSIWMKKEDIRIFAQPFLHPVIDTVNLKNLFTEKSFLDQTINAFTFSYDPIIKLPDSMQLRRWDVYIDPQKSSIKRIYMVKKVFSEGKDLTVQLTWKAGSWCKITTINEEADKAPEVYEERMIWNFNEQ